MDCEIFDYLSLIIPDNQSNFEQYIVKGVSNERLSVITYSGIGIDYQGLSNSFHDKNELMSSTDSEWKSELLKGVKFYPSKFGNGEWTYTTVKGTDNLRKETKELVEKLRDGAKVENSHYRYTLSKDGLYLCRHRKQH